MKIIYGNDFLSKMKQSNDFVKLTQFAIGNIYSISNIAKNPQALFDLSYIEGDTKCLGRYDLESIWESSNRTLRMNFNIPTEAKESLSSDNYELIYIFYNDFINPTDQIAFILANVWEDRGQCVFGPINSFSGASTDEVDNPLDIEESLSSSNNYFKITLPEKISGDFITKLTNNALLLEGPGILGQNWFSCLPDDVKLISRESYEVALLNIISSSESSVYPYLDSTGKKQYESFRYKEYSDLIIEPSPGFNVGYINPKTIVVDSSGGIIELNGTASYIEYCSNSGVVTKIGSGVDKVGNIPGLSIEIKNESEGFDLIAGNDKNRVYIIYPESTDNEFKSGTASIYLNSYEGKKIYPNNLIDGELRIVQNEQLNWIVKYPDTSFVEENTPLYLFESRADLTKDFLIKTNEFSDKSELTITIGSKNIFDDWFNIDIYNLDEFKEKIKNQINIYVSQLRSIEETLLDYPIGRKINGVLGESLLRNWTLTRDDYELLLETRNFCLSFDNEIASKLNNIISFVEPNITNDVGRSEYFENELNEYLNSDNINEDYRGHYQYIYLLNKFDKNSFNRALSKLTKQNIVESTGAQKLSPELEEELSEYLRTNLLAYFSKLHTYLVLDGNGLERYTRTVDSIITEGKSTWVDSEAQEGYNLFYVRVTSKADNTLETWGPRYLNTEYPISINISGQTEEIYRSFNIYCVQKPVTISLECIELNDDKTLATTRKKICLDYSSPEDNIIIGTTDIDLLNNFVFTVYRYDYRLNFSDSIRSFNGTVIDHTSGKKISISDPISFSSEFKSGSYLQTELSGIIILGCNNPNESFQDSSLLVDWRKNTTLSRLEIPVCQRGYKPAIDSYTTELELSNLGYYEINVLANSDITVTSLLDGLTISEITWTGEYSETTYAEAKIKLLYAGANETIMETKSVSVTKEAISIIPVSKDLDYWYPDGYLDNIVYSHISLTPSSKFSISPEPSTLYISSGEIKELTILSPGRRVYVENSDDNLSITGPQINMIDSSYVNHRSYISVNSPISATSFPITTYSTVSYWASGIKTDTKSDYKIYVLPSEDFVTVSGDNNGYIYLSPNTFNTSIINLTAVNGANLEMIIDGSGFSVSGFSKTSTRQTLNITSTSQNEDLLDKVLGTIRITSYIDSSSVISGQKFSENLMGNTITLYIIQSGLGGKLGLGNSNDLIIPLGGVSSKYILGTVSRPSADYEVEITNTDNLNIWLDDWIDNKASLYISNIPSHPGYTPSLTYQKDSYEWEGISDTIFLGKLKIKVSDIYEETHSLIQPGITSGTLVSDKFYLGPRTINTVIDSDIYSINIGKYSTASKISDQTGKKVFFSCPTGVTIVENNSPFGDSILSFPEESGEYSIVAGELTINVNKLNSTYRVFSDSTVEFNTIGEQINEVHVSGSIPEGMSISQVIPMGGPKISGFIGSDGTLSIWINEECHEGDNIRSSISLHIPGQSVQAGEIEYVQYTSYVGVNDKIFKFTNSGTNILKDIVMSGQVNNSIKPNIEVTGWPSFIEAATMEIVEFNGDNMYKLRCNFTIKPGTTNLRDFTITGIITANYISSLGSGEFKIPVTYTFYYVN